MPASSHARFIDSLLEKGVLQIGEILVFQDLSLCHRDDASREDISISTDPWHAVEIARYDDAGRYRPLKTAGNLRHGWRLKLSSSGEVLTALDFLYPGAVGMASALAHGRIVPANLRATLERQTGMYAVVKKVTGDQARQVVSDLCCGPTPCLRRKLWGIEPTDPSLDVVSGAPSEGLPLLCPEACNLFVAAGRKIVKGERGAAAE
ncbi:hypothetical protein TSACC_21637 [Terrimicrobium sacchariphilum]|uniref:Uncharacterized protein n=1 Tax=Terrimicrobium sacchariphilum TaxID=690879 RepID=A0A146G8N8_TERSA|nr:DR2241 family protein [Terrimicrobium sacchariphilum]GAT33227.1 hypothetical protein TSACC_21637 [Terrimicrobium sacchariphilum]